MNSNSIFDISDRPIDDKVRGSLRALAIMAGTAAAVMLINAIISLASAFVPYGQRVENNREGFDSNNGLAIEQGVMMGVVLQAVIFLAVWGVLFYFLFGFSRKTLRGLDGNSQELVTTGLGNLASYFKILGVLLCIGVGLMLLGLLAIL